MRSRTDPLERPFGGAGTAIFAGGGAWWQHEQAGTSGVEAALVLRGPERVLKAHSAAEVPDLLAEVDREQARGNYVAGYLAYEAGAAFGLATQTDRVLESSRASGGELMPSSAPLAWMSVYPPESVQRLQLAAPAELPGADTGPTALVVDVTDDEYSAAIAAVRDFIAAGDTYQVNYTVRARFDLRCNPLDYFLERATSHPVPYAAYLDMGPAQVISLSPELFLRRRGEIIESRPMKGTRPRGTTVAEDVQLAHQLIGSEKDRAEDLMIVDMVRNDLGRISKPGTVVVPALYTVEPYGTVWQMSSTVNGQLVPGAGVRSIMAATFPGASITGAPKHHTMEIIRDLEKEPRGVYTGSVGLFLPGGDFTCNLCIRTILHRQGRSLLGVGSGVVWDSDAAEEHEETLTKAAFAFPPGPTRAHTESATAEHRAGAFAVQAAASTREADLGLIETLLLLEKTAAELPLDRYRFLSRHLDRMEASARIFGLDCDRQSLLDKLAKIAAEEAGPLVVRVELDRRGLVSTATRSVPVHDDRPVDVALSPFRTDPHDRLLRHKTTLRSLYDREHSRALDRGLAEIFFLNRLDRVTEGSVTNICARLGKQWLTPPARDGLLPGIWRDEFMSAVGCEERSLTLDDLLAADEVVIGNSVRGSRRVGTIRLNDLAGLLD